MKAKFYQIRAIILIYIVRLLSKLLLLEYPPVPSVTALIPKGKKLLFVNLSYAEGYGLPGGIVDEGETLEEALKREVYEETGLKVRKYEYFRSTPAKSFGAATLSVVFRVKTSGTLRPSGEGSLVWKEPAEVLDKLVYQDSKITLNSYLGRK